MDNDGSISERAARIRALAAETDPQSASLVGALDDADLVDLYERTRRQRRGFTIGLVHGRRVSPFVTLTDTPMGNDGDLEYTASAIAVDREWVGVELTGCGFASDDERDAYVTAHALDLLRDLRDAVDDAIGVLESGTVITTDD